MGMARRTITPGFTLVELLVVMAVIALLAAMLFPAFASARGAARKAVCLSNLRQLGMAVSLYSQDYDDFYPYGADPSDGYTSPPIWGSTPFAAEVLTMPLLNPNPYNKTQGVLDGYVKDRSLWQCPSDNGYTRIDTGGYPGPAIMPPALPTAFAEYGTSYFYRTEIALRRLPYSSIAAYDYGTCEEHGSSEVNVLMDGSGSFHGGVFTGRRYNVLMGDGHAVSQNQGAFDRSWQRPLTRPTACP